jgi:Protein of unknown function (DUF3606).
MIQMLPFPRTIQRNEMAYDKTKRGPADRFRINIHEAYEVEYWSKELGISPERLRELVTKHR